MIRVLHIVGGMDRAGAETMIMNLYRNIDRNKVQFDFLYFTDKKCDFDDEIESLGGHIFKVSVKNPIQRFTKVLKFLLANSYKIVHSHTLFNTGFNLLAAYIAEAPFRITHSHSTYRDRKGFLNLAYIKLSKFLIRKYSTEFIACGNLSGKYLFGNKSNFLILNNSVDVRKFHQIGITHKNYWLNSFNINESFLKIIQVGRLQEVKNHKFSLKICKELKEKNINFKFFIVGQGILDSKIKQTILKLGLSDYVTLLGLRKDIPELMAGADIHLMPSLYEGFPVTLVESQAIGLHSIVSNNISNEVDLGLGLTQFLNIKSGENIWVNNILKYGERESNFKKKSKILIQKGFDSLENAQRLQSLYLNMN